MEHPHLGRDRHLRSERSHGLDSRPDALPHGVDDHKDRHPGAVPQARAAKRMVPPHDVVVPRVRSLDSYIIYPRGLVTVHVSLGGVIYFFW